MIIISATTIMLVFITSVCFCTARFRWSAAFKWIVRHLWDTSHWLIFSFNIGWHCVYRLNFDTVPNNCRVLFVIPIENKSLSMMTVNVERTVQAVEINLRGFLILDFVYGLFYVKMAIKLLLKWKRLLSKISAKQVCSRWWRKNQIIMENIEILPTDFLLKNTLAVLNQVLTEVAGLFNVLIKIGLIPKALCNLYQMKSNGSFFANNLLRRFYLFTCMTE